MKETERRQGRTGQWIGTQRGQDLGDRNGMEGGMKGKDRRQKLVGERMEGEGIWRG